MHDEMLFALIIMMCLTIFFSSRHSAAVELPSILLRKVVNDNDHEATHSLSTFFN